MLAKSPHLTVRDNQANIVNTAQVEVLEAGTQNQAPVFQDRDGAVSLSQPFQVNTKGVISFYAEGGLYDLKITNDGDVTMLTDIQIGTAQSKDAPQGESELLGSVYIESDSEPSGGVIWQKKNALPTNMLQKIVRNTDSETGNQVLDKVLFSAETNKAVAKNRLPIDPAPYRFNTGSSSFKIGDKTAYYIDSNIEPYSSVIAFNSDFTSVSNVQNNVVFMELTDRGVAVGYDDGVNSGIKFYTDDADVPNEEVTISTGKLGFIASTTKNRLSKAGDKWVYGQNNVLEIWDISGASASLDFTADLNSQSSYSDIEGVGLFELSGTRYIGCVTFPSFANNYFSYFDLDDPNFNGPNQMGMGYRDVYYPENCLIIPTTYEDIDFEGYTINDTSMQVYSLNFTAPAKVTHFIGFYNGFVYFIVKNMGLYKAAPGDLSSTLVYSDPDISGFKDNGDFVFLDKGTGATDVVLFEKATGLITAYKSPVDLDNQFSLLGFNSQINPRVDALVKIDGEWEAVGNNLAALGLPEYDKPDLGQDLNKLAQEHEIFDKSALFLSPTYSVDGTLGSDSITLGDSKGAKGTSAIAIGADSDANSDSAIAIGDAEAYGVSSIAIGGYCEAKADNAISIGESAEAAGESSVAIGSSADVTGAEATSVGSSSEAYGYGGCAFGYYTEANFEYAVAVGYDSSAGANGAAAIGYDATATGENSFAGGYEAVSGGSSSVAIGNSTSSAGFASIAIGSQSNASKANNISIGADSDAIGNYDVAVGPSSQATGGYSIAFGNMSYATGGNSTALGYSATADGEQAVAIGSNANTNGKSQSVALGFSTQVDNADEVAIGNRRVNIQGDKGIRLQSPDGQKWDVTVDNTGNLVVTAFNVV